MSQDERTYSVLIVSSSKNFKEITDAHFPEADYQPLCTVQSVNAARRKASEYTYDFVIINSPLPDDTGIRFAIDAAANSAVLLLLNNEIYSDISYKVSEHGVFSLPKPFSKALFATAVNWLASARELIRKSQKKTHTIEEKMDEIRIVNRAKWILINEKKMAEPEAHRYIEKQAMDRCVSKGEIAKEIISQYG